MPAKHPYLSENFWLDRSKFEEAEQQHYENESLLSALDSMPAAMDSIMKRFDGIEKEQREMKTQLKQLSKDFSDQIKGLSAVIGQLKVVGAGGDAGADVVNDKPVPAAAPVEDEDDDDVDIFGDDDEEEDLEAAKIREERLAAYAQKKSTKTAVIAKSSVVLDVKPWSDETDMMEVERLVRTIVKDGLIWGAGKLVEIGYGIKKLQIGCVVEDDKIGIEELSEEIQEFEDHVQSVDIAAFNKI